MGETRHDTMPYDMLHIDDMDASKEQTPAWRNHETDEHDHRGRHLSYQRSRHNTRPKTSLIKIEGVDDTPAAKYVPEA